VNRCQALLQQGLFVADVAHYQGDHVPNFAQHKRTDPAQVLPGYDYDILTEEVVLTRLSVRDGRIVLPDGMSYRILTLPPRTVISLPVMRKLKELDELVASLVKIEIPFDEYVTGKYAFHHKAGMHTKAIYVNPNSYEILDPADFGLTRTMNIAHRLTGHNAVGKRAEELGLTFGKDELREITLKIKALADAGPLSMDQLDNLLREWVVA
jgi:hypothetical protein